MPPSEKTLLKQARREQRERDLAAKILALPEKRYGVILADPAYRFKTWSRVTGMDRSADNHYATSTNEQIMAIDVASIAAKDCVLYLWTTRPMEKIAHAVMEAWGFEYKTQQAWDKEVRGTGFWTIDYHENLLIGATSDEHDNLLIGTRGKVPCPAPGTQWPSIVRERKRGHSEKPEWVYQIIERHFPNMPKIELFARTARAGWDCWGLEAPPSAEAAE